MPSKPPEQPNVNSPSTTLTSEPSKSGQLITVDHGAYMYTKHVGLEMIVYPIDESRLESLSMLNGGVTLCFSIGTGLALYAFGLATDLTIVLDKDVPVGVNELAPLFYTLCAIGAVIAYGIGIALWWKRGSIVRKIKAGAIQRQGSS